MKQYNQIGKYTKKEDLLNAKAGRTFQTPSGIEYIFNYKKEGQRYIFLITYKNQTMQIKESDFNLTNVDELLKALKNESEKIESGFYN